jgi:hypothetical protein
MLDRAPILAAVAAGTFLAAALFLAVLAFAGWRRSRGATVGPWLVNLVAALGGIAIGMMLLSAGDLLIALPLLVAILVLELGLLRQGRLHEAGWLLAGATAPWSVLWAASVVEVYRGSAANGWRAILGFLAGAIPMLFGLILARVRRVTGGAAAPADRRSAPGGRQLGDIARAILAPAAVGPFGLPEVSLLVGLVATWLVGGLVLPSQIPEPVRLGVLVVLGAVVGTEAWILGMPSPARRAFEAFSWLAERELATARALTGADVPTTARAARRWLVARPEREAERWLRVEILLLAGRLDEARAVAERMPSSTPLERFDRADALDIAAWYAGGDGDYALLERAAADLDPADEEARLRAQVVLAAAKVRRRLADRVDVLDASLPLREVRQQLGPRANGQLGRAMRPRLWRTLLVVGAGLAGLTLVVEALVQIG